MVSELPTGRTVIRWPALILLMAISCTAAEPAQHLQDLNKALMQAAKKGDYRAAEAALEKGADPNARVFGTWLNYTPLLEAITEGHRNIAELLLDWGADAYAEDENHDSAIGFAAEKGKESILELLLSRGVPINWKTSVGWTPAERGDLGVLLKYGIDPNQRTADGGCLLTMAAFNDSPEQLKLLLDHRANLNAQDDDGNTAVMVAIYQNRQKAITFLINAGADLNIQNKAGESALSRAIGFRTNTASVLIEHGANVNLADQSGKTLLMEAASTASLAVLNELILHGANVSARTKTGETAVHFAAGFSGLDWNDARSVENRHNPVEIISSLEAHGADVKAGNTAGQSALHFAADTGYAGTLQELLNKHLDPRASDNHGDTPLYKAIASHTSDRVEKVKLLISPGVNVANNDGDTPLHIAAREMDASVCSTLLDNGADVDKANKKGETPLLLAASNFNRQYVDPKTYAEVIRLFASKTSAIDGHDNRNMTAAMWAAASNVPEALEPIIAKGADTNARSADGRNCLMWAASANAIKTIQVLLHHGADAKATDKAGRTAAGWARLLGYDETTRQLDGNSAGK
jgi:ankyrin repeat protein